LSKNFQRQSCSAVIYLRNGINILAWDDPVARSRKIWAWRHRSPIGRMRLSRFTRSALCSQR